MTQRREGGVVLITLTCLRKKVTGKVLGSDFTFYTETRQHRAQKEKINTKKGFDSTNTSTFLIPITTLEDCRKRLQS